MAEQLIGRPVEILLVEDNPGDARLAEEALRDGKVLHNLVRAANGEEAMDVLRRRGDHADAARPDLILLDLNLPRMHGREVLAAVRADEGLKGIPVIIMTTSEEDLDIQTTMDLGATSYIVKPLDMDQFLGVLRLLDNYWLALVERPGD